MNHMKLRSIFAALVFTPALLVSLPSQACQGPSKHTISESELINISLHDLQHSDDNTHLYNFRTHQCDALNHIKTDAAMAAHLPSDEQWQGLYLEYRHKGEDSRQALVHVFNNIMEDDESAGWSYSLSRNFYAE